jgi:FtsH-binding integral membrane protein
VDLSLLALFALIVAVVILSTRFDRRTWPGQPGHRFRRVFSIGAFGLWLTVAGAIGWDVSHVRGFFRGTAWVGSPIWWQFGLGIALLAVAFLLARRVTYPSRQAPSRR